MRWSQRSSVDMKYESILTDKGLEFDSSAMLVLATELGIDKKDKCTPPPSQRRGGEIKPYYWYGLNAQEDTRGKRPRLGSQNTICALQLFESGTLVNRFHKRLRLQKEKRAENSKEVLTTQRFKVGDEVLFYSPTRKGQVKSLHRAWAGPYIVIQCREGNTYRIKNSDNFRQRFIRHHDQLDVTCTLDHFILPNRAKLM
ncbi:hypothetical protein QZH41_020181 [Actinostola sp. cb2023]|nr:hypothetical protein QZH41_020181 [Actinostola sp. cb2023]